MSYLIHFNKNHDPKNGRFTYGDGDNDGRTGEGRARNEQEILPERRGLPTSAKIGIGIGIGALATVAAVGAAFCIRDKILNKEYNNLSSEDKDIVDMGRILINNIKKDKLTFYGESYGTPEWAEFDYKNKKDYYIRDYGKNKRSGSALKNKVGILKAERDKDKNVYLYRYRDGGKYFETKEEKDENNLLKNKKYKKFLNW